VEIKVYINSKTLGNKREISLIYKYYFWGMDFDDEMD
jgi:hypothetical protein